jgi:hypothetical protein
LEALILWADESRSRFLAHHGGIGVSVIRV